MDSQDPNESIYERWLELPAEVCPPNYYVLLGVDEFESDTEVIDEGARSRTSYLHQIAAGPNRKEIQKLLGEVAVARRKLLNAETKAEYDQWLSTPEEETPAEESPAEESPPIAAPPIGVIPPTAPPPAVHPPPAVAPRPVAVRVDQPENRGPVISSADNHPGQEGREPRKSGKQRTSRGSKSNSQKSKPVRSARKQKSAWDSYKFHLLSAAVLLACVGVFWFFNQGGGRKAAPIAAAPSVSKGRAPSGPGFRAPPRRTNRVSSGLTGPVGFDPNDILNPSAAASQARGNGNKAPTVPKSVKYDPPQDWLSGLKVLNGFKADIATAFTHDPSRGKISLDKQSGTVKLMVKKNNPFSGQIVHKNATLKTGQTLSLDVKLSHKPKSSIKIGLGVGFARVVLQPFGKSYNLLTRNSKASNQPKKLEEIPVKGKLTNVKLLLSRVSNKEFRWALTSNEITRVGRLPLIDSLPEATKILVAFTCPREADQTASFSNLQIGKVTWPE